MTWYAVVFAVLVIAWVFHLSLVSYAMYVLLLVLFASRYAARMWMDQLHGARLCGAVEAEIDDEIAIELTVENRGWLPIVWLLVEDVISPSALGVRRPRLVVEGERLQLFLLKPRETKKLVYRLQCKCRGYYQIGPLLAETGDLFGLHRRHRILVPAQYLTMWPKIIPISEYALASRRPLGEIRLSHRLYEDPTRIVGIREYQPGDTLTRVHWRATARTGTLQCKIYEPSTILGATLLLDFHRLSYDPKHEPMRSELAITACASLAHTISQLGQQIGLITNGRDAIDRAMRDEQKEFRDRDSARDATAMREANDRLRPIVMETRVGAEQLQRIFQTLARLELTDGLTFAQLLLEADARLPRDATVIAVVPNTREETIIALQNLQRRGLAVVALLNIYDLSEFSSAAIPLMAAGIDVRQLRDEEAISAICGRLAVR